MFAYIVMCVSSLSYILTHTHGHIHTYVEWVEQLDACVPVRERGSGSRANGGD
jgi:hypothetical protein